MYSRATDYTLNPYSSSKQEIRRCATVLFMRLMFLKHWQFVATIILQVVTRFWCISNTSFHVKNFCNNELTSVSNEFSNIKMKMIKTLRYKGNITICFFYWQWILSMLFSTKGTLISSYNLNLYLFQCL